MAYSYSTIKKNQKNKKKILDILIVDDDENGAKNLKDLISLRGHNVNIVDDGMRCITHCKDKDRHYDVVFLDYHMDGLDGAQVAEIVKDDVKKTFIFAYTGDSSTKAINKFKETGMDGVIIKPVEITGIDMLMEKLEQSNCLDKTTINTIKKRSSNSILIFDKTVI